MSAKSMGQVFDLVLTPAKRNLLLAMADHADHDGRSIKPGVPYLAWKTDYSERQVQRLLRELEADGIVVIEATRLGKPTSYALDFSKAQRKAAFAPKPKASRRGDKMPPPTPDILSPPQQANGVTSDGKQNAQGGDMASADLSRIRQKEETKEEKNPDLQLPDSSALENTRAALFSPEQQQAWDAAYGQLELQLDRGGFETYVRDAALVRVEDGVYVIGVRSDYARQVLESRFYRMVRRVLRDVIADASGKDAELKFVVSEGVQV